MQGRAQDMPLYPHGSAWTGGHLLLAVVMTVEPLANRTDTLRRHTADVGLLHYTLF